MSPSTGALFAVALGTILMQASTVSAQYALPLKNSGLTPADIDMAMDAAKALYSDPQAQRGDRMEWSNPTSKAFGTVTMEEVDAASACVVFVHFIDGPRAGQQSFVVRRCRNEAGDWLIAP